MKDYEDFDAELHDPIRFPILNSVWLTTKMYE